MKKFFSLLLCMTTLLGCGTVGGVTSSAATFAMPNFFADNMMFQRNKPMNLFGVGTVGQVITAELYETNDTIVPIETVQVTVPADGNWSLSFKAREGSYQHYRIVVYQGTTVMRVIHTVYVGELWLAAGQSNMEYRLDWEKDGAEEIANANDPYLRVLLMTGNPVGTDGAPITAPSFDIHGAVWIDGANQTYIGSVSANAYYACKQLREKLDMPVGFINAPLGSTNIQTWLSRESIEENTFVKTSLERSNAYISAQTAATKASDYRDMCAMFNTKVGPLAGLNLAGVLWCQGESNRDGAPNNEGFYKEAIGALAKGYSKLFGYQNGDMPVIVINIANHPYLSDPQNIPKWIEEIADAAKENPNIVNIPIYDVPLTYKNPPDPSVAYSIHPNTKKPGGTRAGLAAYHNFCKEGKGDYYAPTVSSYEVKEGAMYVTFDNAVNGLSTLNNSIGVHGFTIAGEDGLFLPAKAEIQEKNVVKVWHESIETPVNFTYAFNSHAQTANLCNSYNLPAVPFRSNRDMKQYFGSNDWMYCEDTVVFVNDGLQGEYQPAWQASGSASLTVDTATRYEGVGSLRLDYTMNTAGTVSAVSTFKYYMMPFNLTKYQTISVMVKNPDNREKKLRLLAGKSGTNELWEFSSATTPGVYEVTLPANSDFTQYTFLVKNSRGHTATGTLPLTQVNRIDVLVSDNTSGKVYIDDITVGATSVKLEPFTSYTENLTPIYHVGLTTATSSDPTWNDYHYIGQEFIPSKESLDGISLPLHLSQGKATLHLELRSSINDTAFACTDVEIESKGNNMQWYDILFESPVKVTPNQMYYLVYYLTAREDNSVCIAYGRDLGMDNAVHYGYAWPMANGGTPTLTTVYNQLQFGFQLIESQGPTKEELDKQATDLVTEKINALPQTVTLADETVIMEADKAYNDLTKDQRNLVTNVDKLIAAKEALAALKYPTPEPKSLYGDVNEDEKVDAKDALQILKVTVNKASFTEEQTTLADVYQDGKINAKDALYVLRYAVQKEEALPVVPAGY